MEKNQKSDIACRVKELSMDSTSTESLPQQVTGTPPSTPPRVRPHHKAKEIGRLGITRAKVFIKDKQRDKHEQHIPISDKGKWTNSYVEPLCFWWGRNSRILLGQSLPCTQVRDIHGAASTVINATSHNYAGFYEADPRSDELQRLCLEKLPLADAQAVPMLEMATHEVLVSFWRTDFCYTTSTGYGSNYVAFPALVNSLTLVIADDKCHNSMFTGIFLTQPGERFQKFAHNDMSDLERILAKNKEPGGCGQILVAVEGLYSMEADVPPLYDLHKLKQQYNFVLFCDEAHSMLSIGRTGRGCLEYWNDHHPNERVPEDVIDIRTATLSKPIGGIGGLITGKKKFMAAVQARITSLHEEGGESLGTSTMVQTLWVLGQPSMIFRNLARLSDMSRFCRSELARFGIYVWGEDGTPMLPVYVGRPTYAGRFSYLLRQSGVLVSPVVAPAVDFWEGRARINLSAKHTDDEINKMIDAIIQGSRDLGLCNAKDVDRRPYRYQATEGDAAREENETSVVYERLRGLILYSDEQMKLSDMSRPWPHFESVCHASIVKAGQEAQKEYGLGSGGSRWISGTFPPHLAVESLITQITGMKACLTYPDASIGLASTIAALCRPLHGFTQHYLLIPKDAVTPVLEGQKLASPKERPGFDCYQDAAELYHLVEETYRSGGFARDYFTIYLYAPDKEALLQLRAVIARLLTGKPRWTGLTILIHSPTCIPRDPEYARIAALANVELLIFGSFHESMGLSGAFVAGSSALIQELRFTSRGYMFTTSPQPFVMEMVRKAIESEEI